MVDLSQYCSHVSASLIKVFLSELPTPVMPSSMYSYFSEPRVTDYFSPCTLLLVKELTRFLQEVVAKSDQNKMIPNNLAIGGTACSFSSCLLNIVALTLCSIWPKSCSRGWGRFRSSNCGSRRSALEKFSVRLVVLL
jgi:hypothetical protein